MLERELERVVDDLLESDEFLRPDFGRTHPLGVAKPRGVMTMGRSAVLLDRVYFRLSGKDTFFVCRLCVVWISGLLGTKANEERESRCESCEKVSMASWREVLERESSV
jgi:hypothetical protein